MHDVTRSTDNSRPRLTTRVYVERFLVGLGLVGLALLLVKLADVLLLVFGAALVAVIFRAIADPLQQRLRLPGWLALLASVLAVIALLAGAIWLMGAQLAQQVGELRGSLPAAWSGFEERIGDTDLGERIMGSLRDATPDTGGIAADLGGFVFSLGGAVSDFVLVVIAGIFLAAEPRLYRRGVLKIFPPRQQAPLGSALDNTGRAMRLWLLGQLFSMTVVGVFTGLGLWLVGVPSPLALGLFAGLAQFVPIVGPFVSAVPGTLLALVAGPETALYALLVYVGIQQVESNALTPLVQRRAVSLPPAVTLFAVLGLGVIFGPLGILLSGPLAVLVYVFVNQLYVRDTLGQEADVPGEDKG